MERRYSEYSYGELRSEVAQLTEKTRKAEQMGMVNEYAVYERKIVMAKAYMMNPEDFESNRVYQIKGDPGHTFHIDYMNGVFAWGYRINLTGAAVGEREEALPISMLGEKVNQ
ncbi:YfhH family protein [Halobacillus sp. A5]|uniref:YfhH family protein n=1 Tax=Halobacillus sp. A5 TaxID=2880263 RepID=UPI0020A6D64A|nr:YfhH family protein [Halobacillus sp. A5]MCP3028850.1 YfhH family protein [Halobacillus sp. A5]